MEPREKFRYFIKFTKAKKSKVSNLDKLLDYKLIQKQGYVPIEGFDVELEHRSANDYFHETQRLDLYTLQFSTRDTRLAIDLLNLQSTGKMHEEAVIRLFDAQNTPVMNVYFGDLSLSDISQGSKNLNLNQVSFSYTRTKWEYVGSDKIGGNIATTSSAWDLKKAAGEYEENFPQDDPKKSLPGQSSVMNAATTIATATTLPASETKEKSKKPFKTQIIIHDQPLANKDFQLKSNGEIISGQTDPDGNIDVEVPEPWKDAVLTVDKYKWTIDLMPELTETQNTQQKLTNSGFYHGKIDGISGEKTKEALKKYQIKHNLPYSEAIDDETQTKLDKQL